MSFFSYNPIYWVDGIGKELKPEGPAYTGDEIAYAQPAFVDQLLQPCYLETQPILSWVKY